MCALAVSRLLTMLHPRYGRLRTHHTLRFLYLCFLLFVLIVGVAWLHMMNPVNREAVPLVHTIYLFMCCVFFSSHTPLSFERESSETILLFSDSGGSEVEPVKIVLGHVSWPAIWGSLIGLRSFFLLAPSVPPESRVFLRPRYPRNFPSF